MIEPDLYSSVNSKVVLVLGADKKVKDCSKSFLNTFDLEKVPTGTHVDTLFDMRGNDVFTRHLALQPFRCVWRSSGKEANGLLMGGIDGYHLIFEEPGREKEAEEDTINVRRFSRMINNMQEGVSIFHLFFKDGIAVDYIVEDINSSCEEALGMSRENVVGKRAGELFDGHVPFLHEIERVVLSGKPIQFERYLSRFRKHFRLSVSPLGENRFGIVFSDLTQLIHMQELQKSLNNAANAMSEVFETGKIFDAAAFVLRENGLESMLVLLDRDMSVKRTYWSFAGASHVYQDKEPMPLNETFREIAYERHTIFIEDFDVPSHVLKAVGLRGQLKGIAAPVIVTGAVYGVFVIISSELKASELPVVTVFANLMGSTIERTALIQSLKRNIDELSQSKQAHEYTAHRLSMASNASRVGFWEYDLESDLIYIDDTARQLYGIEQSVIEATFDAWKTIIHPDDHVAALAALRASVKSREDCVIEFRINKADGTVQHVRSVGKLHKSGSGDPLRMVGSAWDITERKKIEVALRDNERQLREIFDLLPVGLWITDKEGRIIKGNPAGERIWDGKIDHIDVEKRIWRYPSGEAIKTGEWALGKTVRHGLTIQEEMLEIETIEGNRKIVINSTAPVRDENGCLQAAIMINRDVTDNETAKAALKSEKELLSTTLQSIGEGVVVTDAEGRITTVNTVFEQLSGTTQMEAKGCPFDDVVQTVSERKNPCPSLIEKTLHTGRIISRSNGIQLLCKNGRKVPIAHTVSPICDGNGQIIGTVLVIRNITEQKKRQKKIDYLVYHDALTGVYNRRYFDQMLRKIDTEENLPISIINCDVNGLKLTNDAFGHSAGDELLMRMSAVLVKACRSCDIVARSGGDEFMILMPKADESAARNVCSEIKALAEKNSLNAIDCSISVGYDTKNNPDENLKSIINKAEAFMYRNKSFESPYMRGSSINNILSTLHEKHNRERLHCSHVSEIGSSIAHAMGLSDREINEISLIGRMHDIGKIAVNETLFSKPDILTEEEWIDMKRHPEVGFRILSASTDTAYIAKSVLAHHERFDGNGYPNGLKGSSIPIMARILAVADAYEAMTNERPYRATKSKDEALRELVSLRGSQFDPAIVDIFLKLNCS